MNEQTSVYTAEGADAGEVFSAYANAFVNSAQKRGLKSREWLLNKAAELFKVYYERALDSDYDKYGIPLNEQAAPDACARCQCNACANINTCELYEPTDGITPPPCTECDQVHPLLPIEVSACEGYDAT